MKYRVILLLVLAAAIASAGMIAISKRGNEKTFWIAPSDEIVLQLRPGKQIGHVLVMTVDRNSMRRWWIRDIDANGDQHIILSGGGHPGLVPMSRLSFSGDHFVFAIRKEHSLAEVLFDCHLKMSRVVSRIDDLPGEGSLWGIRRAYSPDGRFIVYRGRPRGVWVYDSLKRTSKLVYICKDKYDKDGSASWDRRGNLYYFLRYTGELLRGKGEGKLIPYTKVAPGSIADVTPDGSRLVVVDVNDKTWVVRVHSLRKSRATVKCTMNIPNHPWDIEWSQDGTYGLIFSEWLGDCVLIGPGACIRKLKSLNNVVSYEGAVFLSSDSIVMLDSNPVDGKHFRRLIRVSLKQ